MRLLSKLSLVALASSLALVACGDDDDDIGGASGSGGGGGTAGKGNTAGNGGKGGNTNTGGKGGNTNNGGKAGTPTGGTDTGGTDTGGTDTGGTNTGGTATTDGGEGGTAGEGGFGGEAGEPNVAGTGGGGTGGGGTGGGGTGGGGTGGGGTGGGGTGGGGTGGGGTGGTGGGGTGGSGGSGGGSSCPATPVVLYDFPSNVTGWGGEVVKAGFAGKDHDSTIVHSPTVFHTAAGSLESVITFATGAPISQTYIFPAAHLDWTCFTKLHLWLKLDASVPADFANLDNIQAYINSGPTSAFAGGGFTQFSSAFTDGNWREFVVNLPVATKNDIVAIGVLLQAKTAGATAGTSVTLHIDDITLD